MKNLVAKRAFAKALTEKLEGVNISNVAARAKISRGVIYKWLSTDNATLPRIDLNARLDAAIELEKNAQKTAAKN